MVLLIDHYDSFTFNLYQMLKMEAEEVKVVRSDKITINEIESMDPTHIILSPGPGKPEDAGCFMEVVRQFKKKKPILGICLGHQAILSENGAAIIRAKTVQHGKIDRINHNGSGLFSQLPEDFHAMRYHSLVAEEESISKDFRITAHSADGEVMGVEHRSLNCVGLQFHPESVGTPLGRQLLRNFLKQTEKQSEKKLMHQLMRASLDYETAVQFMKRIMEGTMDESRIAAAMTTYHYRPVTAEELAGFASVMREKASFFPKPEKGEIRVDTCGTGGAGRKSFNVSTTASFVIAAAGLSVVKHGNRAVTSKSGSMDLLEKLGININLTPADSYRLLKKSNLSFLYAPLYHSAMKYASKTRKSLGFKSFFNLLGPLSNPAGATHQVLGVFDAGYLETMCEALRILGVKRALLVSSEDGCDEISICAPTTVCELDHQKIVKYTVKPEDFGIRCAEFSEIAGGDVDQNTAITVSLLKGEANSSKVNMLSLNAGAALYLAGKTDTIKEGYQMACEVIRSGKALQKLNEIRALTGRQ